MNDNPYVILENKAKCIERLNSFGIKETDIFDSLLKDDGLNDVLAQLTAIGIGISNPMSIIGSAFLIALKQHSKDVINEQLFRLRNNPYRINDEVSINIFLFACMGYAMKTNLKAQNYVSDGLKVTYSLFNKSKQEKVMENLLRRNLEILRWSVTSTYTLIFNYLEQCKSQNVSFDYDYVSSVSKYLHTVYYSCESVEELFVSGFGDYLSNSHEYMSDMLLDGSFRNLFSSIPSPNKEAANAYNIYVLNHRDSIIQSLRESYNI